MLLEVYQTLGVFHGQLKNEDTANIFPLQADEADWLLFV